MSSVYIFTTRQSGDEESLFSKNNCQCHDVGESDPLMRFYVGPENHVSVYQWIRYVAENDSALASSVLEIIHNYEPDLMLEELEVADLEEWPKLCADLSEAFGESVYRYQCGRFCSLPDTCWPRYLALKSADNVYCLEHLPESRNTDLNGDRTWISTLVEQFASSDDVTDVYLVLHDKDLSFTKAQPYMVLENDAVPYPCGCVKRIHVVVFQHSANAVMDILKDASCQDVGSCVRRLHAEKALIKAREKAAKCWRNAENMKQLTEEMAQDRHLQEFYPGLTAEGLLEM